MISTNKQLRIVCDSNSIFARAYYAMASQNSVDAAFTVAFSSLLRVIAAAPQEPTHLLLCWDAENGGGHKTDKEREEKPADYYAQRDKFSELAVAMLNAAEARTETEEADDLVATAALRCEAEGNTALIVSCDKDLEQLVSGQVRYWNLKEKRVMTEREICVKWGVERPIQVALALALIGDYTDRIKGVPKIGPKRAKGLLSSLRPEMNFAESIQCVRRQLSATNAEIFEEALALTLLSGDVKDVPQPNPIRFEDPDRLRDFNADSCRMDYLPCLTNELPDDLSDEL